MSFGPFLASIALGFVKGLTVPGDPRAFNPEMDFVGPVREEAIYRGALYLLPGLPLGSTAATFAVDHCLSDFKRDPAPPMTVAARFGDVFLGGLCYEIAMRRMGILGAIGAHCLHNMAVSWGSRARR